MSREVLGATYKLFAKKCRGCHYNTQHNQCLWFEYPEQRKEIEAAKANAEKGAPNCPRYETKHSTNSLSRFVKQSEFEGADDEGDNFSTC